MDLKENRTLSFIIILLIYALACGIGIVVYLALPYSIWLNLLIADVVATVVTYIFSVMLNNASVYDPYWSVQPVVILVGFAFGVKLNLLKVLMLIVVCLWGIRLTANWAYTFKSLNHQDWRYTMLEQKTGKFYQIVNFLGIHMFPTIVVYLVTLPAVFVFNSEVLGNVFSYVFLALSLFAVVLQCLADCQMHKFRKNKNGKTFIRIGVWKYSRHPNYLAEILMWWGIGLSSVLTLNAMWYLLVGALINNLMFLFVSIPLADGKQSKKEGFLEYKSQTRMLLPIKKFKK